MRRPNKGLIEYSRVYWRPKLVVEDPRALRLITHILSFTYPLLATIFVRTHLSKFYPPLLAHATDPVPHPAKPRNAADKSSE